jgi:hypothetical protein
MRIKSVVTQTGGKNTRVSVEYVVINEQGLTLFGPTTAYDCQLFMDHKRKCKRGNSNA